MDSQTPLNTLHQTNIDYNLAVCILASGSRGNSIYISDGDTAILIDAGLSGAEIERRLQSRALSAKNLNAILVSHEHSDHIQAVGVLSRRYQLPVYISPKTKKASRRLGSVHDLRIFECGITFQINNMTIHPFSISHDAEDPVGFTIGQNGTIIGIATDLGVATAMVKQHLKSCSLLILEFNHDPVMLEQGPYPWPIKQRIKSRTGHLSNVESKKLLEELQHDNLKHVILAHLSDTNNTPQKAFDEASKALIHCKARLTVADQHTSGPILYLK
jgi:phosphoribosyl 1,2-cyclic phosphodiesterase